MGKVTGRLRTVTDGYGRLRTVTDGYGRLRTVTGQLLTNLQLLATMSPSFPTFYYKAMRTDIDLMLMVTPKLSRAGLHAESLAAARKIKDPDSRAGVISRIAVDLAKAGAGKHQIISMFREAMRSIRLAELDERERMQKNISSNIIEAGLKKSEESRLLAEVEKSLPPQIDIDIESWLDCASYWAKEGNRNDAINSFRAALVLTLRKEGYLTSRDVATQMVKAKMTPAEIKSVFRECRRKVPDLQ